MPESNGFAPFEGQTVMMGSQATVDIFNQIDDAWGAKDWDLLASYVADDASLTFEDGQTAHDNQHIELKFAVRIGLSSVQHLAL